MSAAPVNLLSVAGLSKHFGGAVALKNASLELNAGETLALMGENGAGKSTLIRILAGAERPDGGQIRLDGEVIAIASPQDAHRRGLRFIHQELNIVPQMSVAENLFLGRSYPRRLGGFIHWRALHSQARAALSELGVAHVSPKAIMARLPVGDRMLVKIAATFLADDAAPARIFVMDEPTAALSSQESEQLFGLIAELKRRGCGVIYVSHRLDEVLAISDRVTVLRDGETRATLATSAASKAGLIGLMTGRDTPEVAVSETAPIGETIALRVENLSDRDLSDISFDIREGEILGVAGLANAGQDRLLKALMGSAKAGDVTLGGRSARAQDPAEAWRMGFALVPRERRSEGLFLRHDVIRNIVLPHLRKLSRFGLFLRRRAESARAGELTPRVRLKSAGLRQKVGELSGGNQQKVMFARALAGSPRVLLLDEPTRGVDVGAKFDIHALLRQLAASGAAILVASSDHEELLTLSHRIAILRDGRIASIVASAGLTPQSLLALCYGDAA